MAESLGGFCLLNSRIYQRYRLANKLNNTPLTSTSISIELITKIDIDALYTEIFSWRNGIRTG